MPNGDCNGLPLDAGWNFETLNVTTQNNTIMILSGAQTSTIQLTPGKYTEDDIAIELTKKLNQ